MKKLILSLTLPFMVLLQAGCSSPDEKENAQAEAAAEADSAEIDGAEATESDASESSETESDPAVEGTDSTAEIEDENNEPAATAEALPSKSLYERMGGQKAVEIFAHEFVTRLAKNKVINSNPQVAAALKKSDLEKFKGHIRNQICQLAGGPCTYSGRSMKAAHAGLKINQKEWNALRKIFIRSLKLAQVPKAERIELASLAARTKSEIVGQ